MAILSRRLSALTTFQFVIGAMTYEPLYDAQTWALWQHLLAQIAAIGSLLILFWFLADWYRLARHFPVREQPTEGQWFRHRSGYFGRIGWLHYRDAIHMCLCEDGIYFRVFFLFRLGHPPFLVPWDRVQAIHRWKFLGGDWIRYRIDLGDGKTRDFNVRLGWRKKRGSKLRLKKPVTDL